MRRALLAALTALLLLAVPASADDAATARTTEKATLTLVSAQRKAAKLKPLGTPPSLVKAAREHAAFLLKNEKACKRRPASCVLSATRLKKAGYVSIRQSSTVARGTPKLAPARAVKGLRPILRSKWYRDSGVGVVCKGTKCVVVVVAAARIVKPKG